MKPDHITAQGSTCSSWPVGHRTGSVRHINAPSSSPCGRWGGGLIKPDRRQPASSATVPPAAAPMQRQYPTSCLGLAALVALAGCSVWTTPKPSPPTGAPEIGTHYLVEFKADENINHDASGRPMPVLLNLFELRSGGSFDSSDYFDLRDAAQARLGQELLRSDQLMIWPGTTEQRSYTLSAEPLLLGVVAGYQQLEGRTWRVLIPFQTPERPTLYQRALERLRSEQEREVRIEVSIRQDGLYVQPLAKD